LGESPTAAVLTQEYVRKEVYRTGDIANPYGSRTNWGEKVYVKPDPDTALGKSINCLVHLHKAKKTRRLVMDFESIILRFRDLVTESGDTVKKHKAVIDQHGYVWWSWWKKGNEKLPVEAFSAFSTYAESQSKDVFLMDSGQKKLYKATCCKIKLSIDQEILSPEHDKTPEYYRDQKYYAWFKFTSIEECSVDSLRTYTYVQVDQLFIENKSNYLKFYGKRIYGINELIQQNRTVWFVRVHKDADLDHEIILLDAHVFEPEDFSTKYFETKSNALLWLSDLHFGLDKVFRINKKGRADVVTLTEHIKMAFPDLPNIGGLIVSGDITSFGNNQGFTDAQDFIMDLNRELTQLLSSENIIFCPGNHDLKRIDDELGEKPPEKVSDHLTSSAAYRECYHAIHKRSPNEYLASGKKLLMKSGRTVEIVALNSLILQQYKDFEGHGYLSQEQLDFVSESMKWQQSDNLNAIRIAVMHHHYLPTCFVEQVEVKRPSSVVYDAERLMSWLQKYNVRFLLHGHKHQTFVSSVGRYPDASLNNLGEMKSINVIGMGGTGAEGCENKFAVLHLEANDLYIEFYRIYNNNTESGKLVQKVRLPI